jgi:hypothetical protein
VKANTPACHFMVTWFERTTGAAFEDEKRASSVN